jgi:HK97 gp10 family phage protein
MARARGAIVRQKTASIYEAARQRAHDIAQEICDEIATNPETPDLTGELRDSYYVDHDSNGDALVKSRVRYWKYVEFGTAKHGHKQPHLRPAIEAVRARHS